MAIELTKTLQTVEYGLYLKTGMRLLTATMVVVEMKGYQSQGHYTDGFLPIISKIENITDLTTVQAFAGSYASTVGLAAAEAWLIANVAWYSGGAVV